MAVIVTLALNGMLGLGGYWTARHGFRQPSGVTRWLAAATLAWAWATAGMEILGVLSLLTRGPLLVWTATGLAVSLILRRIDSRGGGTGEPVAECGRWEWEAVAALAISLWTTAYYGLMSLLFAVKVVSDAPIYHLYLAARWWKAGRLFMIATPFGENAATYFPAVGDLWFTWLMISWGGERLAKIGQAPFLLLAAFAAYAMTRRLGAGRSSSVIATCWFATSSAMVIWSFEANVDTIFVAGYLMAALFFLRYALRDGEGGTLALGALAAGGALVTKSTAVVFVPPLLALAIAAAMVRPGKATRRLGHVLLVLSLPLVMAGYWFGRNLILTGNPIYPLQVSVLGRVFLAGWYGSDVMRQSPYYIPVGDWRALGDILLMVLDPRLAPVWTASVAGAWALGRTRPNLGRWVWGCSGLALLNISLYWFLIPYRSQQRFMLHTLGLAVVPLARLFERDRWLRTAGFALLVVHVLTSQGWPFSEGNPPWDLTPSIPNYVPALMTIPLSGSMLGSRGANQWALAPSLMRLALGAASFAIAWGWSRASCSLSTRQTIRALAVTVVSLGIAIAVCYPRGTDSRLLFFGPFREYYDAWLELDLRSGTDGTRIAYAGTNMPYYLMGVGLRNEVRYINVDEHRDWLLHDYHREAPKRGEPENWPSPRPGWDRLRPDYQAWLANLRAEGVRILVVARANPIEGRHNVADAEGFPIERQWAESHPEAFEPLYGVAQADPEMRIYRVRR